MLRFNATTKSNDAQRCSIDHSFAHYDKDTRSKYRHLYHYWKLRLLGRKSLCILFAHQKYGREYDKLNTLIQSLVLITTIVLLIGSCLPGILLICHQHLSSQTLEMKAYVYPMNVHLPSQDLRIVVAYDPKVMIPIVNTKLQPFILNEVHRAKLRDNTDSFESETCRAMGTWQLQRHPSCNMLHEVSQRSNDFIATKLLSSGSYRDAWLIYWNGVSYAMKTLVSEDEMSARNLDRHRRDAITMEMLSSSIHIPNIYAHCGDSGIFDYSPYGNMKSIIKRVNKNDRDIMWTKEEMLRYAWQVSAALKDVHDVESINGSPAIAHTDVDIDQILWMDDMFKLNDFNRARFIRWNLDTNKPCPFYISSAFGKFRSPEEYKTAKQTTHHDYHHSNRTREGATSHEVIEKLTPKIDVYALGNIFYTILTKEKVFAHVPTNEAQDLVMNGHFPMIPANETLGDLEYAIFQAMQMCHVMDVDKRSSARQVELFLRKEMERFNVSFF